MLQWINNWVTHHKANSISIHSWNMLIMYIIKYITHKIWSNWLSNLMMDLRSINERFPFVSWTLLYCSVYSVIFCPYFYREERVRRISYWRQPAVSRPESSRECTSANPFQGQRSWQDCPSTGNNSHRAIRPWSLRSKGSSRNGKYRSFRLKDFKFLRDQAFFIELIMVLIELIMIFEKMKFRCGSFCLKLKGTPKQTL